jgi:hypothetical protein
LSSGGIKTKIWPSEKQTGLCYIQNYVGSMLDQQHITKKNETKLHGLSPRVNYTDRATALVGEVITNFCG